MMGPPEGGMPPPMPADMPPMPPMMPPQGMPEGGGMSGLPEPLPEIAPPVGNEKGNGLKKQVLQKLMSNLLGKPGRSFNELMNGIKGAIATYKSYAKEVDLLNGVSGESAPEMSGPPMGGSSGDIQKILQGIQAKKAPKDGGGGPGMLLRQPTVVPPSPQPMPPPLIAGPPQQSSFNQQAPISRLGIWGY